MRRILHIFLHVITWRIMRRILRILAGMRRIGNAEKFPVISLECRELGMQRYTLYYGRKAEYYLYSHNRENSLHNTNITQENLLDHHPGQGMQNWNNHMINTLPILGGYLENRNTMKQWFEFWQYEWGCKKLFPWCKCDMNYITTAYDHTLFYI